MKYGVIFDVDGTLFDTGEGIIDCARHALAAVGAPPLAEEKLPGFIGPSLYHSFTVEAYRARYQETGIELSHPYAGIDELLQMLDRDGYALSVASNKPLSMVHYLLDKYGYRKYFRAVFAPDFATRSSDKSDLIRQAAIAEHNVMVGDTRFDIEGAHKAGVKAIAATYGYGEAESLAKADWAAASPREVYEIVRREHSNFA